MNAQDATQANVGQLKHAPTRGRRWGIGSVALAAAVAAGLVAAGAYWHEPVSKIFGSAKAESGQATGDASKPSGAKQKELWTCGMHPQVIQDHPGDCPICHMKLTPLQHDTEQSEVATTERKISYWWDPMLGAGSITDKPGKSAMGMDLVPVYEQDVSGGTAVRIDPVVVQNMGVRTATVTRGPLHQTVRAVGYLEEAQPLMHDVNLRVSGWIEKLYAATEGQHVQKGEPLFELYSPEMLIAVQELIAAKASGMSNGSQADSLANDTSRTLVQSARGKLAQWGLDDVQIEKLAGLDRAPRTVTFNSPVTGHVVVKNIVDGTAVKAGDRVLQIVDHSTLWLDAQVYEQDLPFIRLGQTVQARVEAMSGRTLEGKVIFVHPHVDATTRTATVRVELPNPDLALRPGMYATVNVDSTLIENAVVVPREAIIDTGKRAIVFVSAGNGRFTPRELKLGVGGGDGNVEVLSGISPGDSVVTSGQFLLDSESRMKEAIQRHLDQQLLAPKTASKGEVQEEMKGMPGMPGMTNGAGGMAPAATPSAAGTPTTQVAIAEKLAWTADVDQVYSAYLKLSATLGALAADGQALDVKPLTAVARRLTDATKGPQAELPRKILEAAAAIEGKTLAEQRKGFEALSVAVIAMIDVCPPSDVLGKQLFVAHCPMALGDGADWLQTNETVANPYLPSMQTCGEITRAVPTTPREKK